MNHIIIHYTEIALKGKNRGYFELLLKNNIRSKIKDAKILAESGQLTVKTAVQEKKAREIFEKIPGITYFSFALKVDQDLDSIKELIKKTIEDKKYSTFKIDAKRRDKSFKLTSMEVNKILGAFVESEFKKKVQLDDPDLAIKVEITHKNAYVSFEDIKGAGGMPIDSKQKVVALISGGFDSPVAAYSMMKRGCQVIFVHFQNHNQMDASVEDKVTQIVKQLSNFQNKTLFYIVPFEELQRRIIMDVEANYRMLVYRKFMLKIAGMIAKDHGAEFLVVGDSISQVASQTYENLAATYRNSEIHILSPLIGMDKIEIMDTARVIGTYDISKLPYGDCCSYFLAKHPMLKCRLSYLDKLESKVYDKELIDAALNNAKKIEM
ncbi:MAG: tRNA 4-thiouridine(8) synthase ThiI [Nanoarchaeota archaeon]|nr:tRNA 4-thiouridine(8) synthase ThiI [Nanoarchaeota archaeon]